MRFSDKIKDIRTARLKNKLVIFVGAGVSRNSGIPTWSGLIEEFAKKLKYDKCENCKCKKKGCKSIYCDKRYKFEQDEYLKIPQYYFNKDKTRDQRNYFKLITDTLKSDNASNPLNEMIMKLLPKHIITTNYDKLIENCKSPNTMIYKVIISDKDLLTNNSNNYIIKMHGDIDALDTIVLKEDDYLHYQPKHILIETYIKSLLIDHTFLFIGYSLNDYNLKLILSWIKYLTNEHSVNNNRPNNYVILQSDAPIKKHLEMYYESNNISILNTFDVPAEIKEKCKDIDLPYVGREIYSVLEYIYDEKNDYILEPLSDLLFQKYKIFDGFNRISFEDLLSVHSFGSTLMLGDNLFFNNKDHFNKLKNIIQSTGERERAIKKAFLKAGISSIQYEKDFISFENEKEKTIHDELFELYLNNDYIKIRAKLDKIEDDNLVAYYYYIIMPHRDNLNVKLDEIEEHITYEDNIVSYVIYKYNRILFKQFNSQDASNEWIEFENILSNIPKQYEKAYGFIKGLSIGETNKSLLKCNDLFEKHKRQYLRMDNSVTFGIELVELYELQSKAYNYYFFIKYNNLLFDYFSNPKTYFEPYIKSFLCTFSELKDRPTYNFFETIQDLGQYKLSAVDLDMLIKYTDNKKLKSWFYDFKIKTIDFDEGVNIVNRFTNFCTSMKVFGHRLINNHLSNFIFVLTKCNLTNDDKEKIIYALFSLIERVDDDTNIKIDNCFRIIEYIVYFYRDENIPSFRNILLRLLNIDTMKFIIGKYIMGLSTVYKRLSKYSDTQINKNVGMIIDSQTDLSQKTQTIFALRFLFSDSQKQKYMEIVRDNTGYTNLDCLYRFVVEGFLSLNQTIKSCFIDVIESEIEKRQSQPGVRSFPDMLKCALDYCVLLHLLDIWDNIDCLKPFAKYSDCLSFLVDPKCFDYSKIDTNYYMWENMFRKKKYKDVLMSHKNDILTSHLKKAIDNDYATENQKKILYKYLLSDEELWTY